MNNNMIAAGLIGPYGPMFYDNGGYIKHVICPDKMWITCDIIDMHPIGNGALRICLDKESASVEDYQAWKYKLSDPKCGEKAQAKILKLIQIGQKAFIESTYRDGEWIKSSGPVFYDLSTKDRLSCGK